MTQVEMMLWSMMELLVPPATLVAVAVLGRRYRPEAHRSLVGWAIFVSVGHLVLVGLFAHGLARILRPSFANEVRA